MLRQAQHEGLPTQQEVLILSLSKGEDRSVSHT